MARAAGERVSPALSICKSLPKYGANRRCRQGLRFHLELNQSQNSPDGYTHGERSTWLSGDNFVFHATLGEQQGIGPNQSQFADDSKIAPPRRRRSSYRAGHAGPSPRGLHRPHPHRSRHAAVKRRDHAVAPGDHERLPFALSTVVPQPGLAGKWSADRAGRAPFYFDKKSAPLITATTWRATGPGDLIRCEVPDIGPSVTQALLKAKRQLHHLQYCRGGDDFLIMGITTNAICH